MPPREVGIVNGASSESEDEADLEDLPRDTLDPTDETLHLQMLKPHAETEPQVAGMQFIALHLPSFFTPHRNRIQHESTRKDDHGHKLGFLYP